MPGLDVGLKEVTVITYWYLWWMRRQRTHNEFVPPLFKCKMSILKVGANSAKALSRPTNSDVARSCNPEPRQVKLNVDASFHCDLCAGSIGVVLPNYQGNFLAGSSVYLPHVATTAMAEALAMHEGLSFSQQNRLQCSPSQI